MKNLKCLNATLLAIVIAFYSILSFGEEVTRSDLSTVDKVWMLEALTGLNVERAAIEAASFNQWMQPSAGGRWVWNAGYIEGQWQVFVQQEAITFAIQAVAKDWIKGAYYSLANDRFIVTDVAMLQASLVQGLSTLGNRQDAIFAAVTLNRLHSDGCDLQAVNDASITQRRVA